MNTRAFSVVALLLLGLSAQAKDDARFLQAIGQVESGLNRKAIGKAGERGMYQVGKAAWDDASDRLKAEGHYAFPWSKWRDATAQDMIAAAHLRWIRSNLDRHGYTNPSPEQVALVWNVGFSAAKARGFRPNDYALRVANIYRLPPTPVRQGS
jgi:hypothetical protein